MSNLTIIQYNNFVIFQSLQSCNQKKTWQKEALTAIAYKKKK
jgi:hypothetical protein